ncbi:MAG: Carbon monoxide dehydrogenase molybdenum cofactor insertion protein CoxF [Hydrogenibacillus schlegelii]|uniref:Carbon monoxide dehydrogenase molybdenum cofactor insertion protein CoxF n=1 Tax=Hydrogenibacillus schlegelii TaxID=1484 RepID=A0A2T5GDW7_HYDSH|nr:XdhC family protein [Hydrogenibacillus schlegelii]PTQ54369.1 MAG: Carbon monoxide dehydrogenase molybdenum cofactor insertion protein CoxF [Hydrogenibacillus schlegelii]
MDERAEPYVWVTVVRRVRPSSATVGDKAIVTSDGEMIGFVGGHCTRDLVIGQAKECLKTGESKLLLVTPHPPAHIEEGVTVASMTCASEGTVELFLEPRHIEPLLIIVGNSPVATALEALAPRFSFVPRRIAVEEMDLSEETGDPFERLRHQVSVLARSAVYGVVATMGLYDAEGLLAFAPLSLRYLGLVASPKRWNAVRAEMEKAGAPETFLDFITAPAGFDIGAVGAQEIALSILAEIVERRRRKADVRWEGQATEAAVPTGEAAGAGAKAGAKAGARARKAEERRLVIDPVCGMTVDLATTPHRLEWNGTMYGFCCAGCKSAFERNPEMYVTSQR